MESSITQPDYSLIGWRERVALPDLGIASITAKTDTGAFSSSIHALSIESFKFEGDDWVRFDVLTSRKSDTDLVPCEAPVVARRNVKSSDGAVAERIFILTRIILGKRSWDIEMSLSNRSTMGYRMLLGRTAIRGRFLVDANRSFLAGRALVTSGTSLGARI